MELLLKHGANPLQQNSTGKSPVDLASSLDMGKLLRKEIITSSSDSSSLDDMRSPASPESISSLKEEDFRNSDNEEKGTRHIFIFNESTQNTYTSYYSRFH